MDVAAVVDRFDLGAEMRGWLEEASGLPVPEGGLPLPGRAEAPAVLARLGCEPRDAEELLEIWPDASWPVELWWLMERMYAVVAADLAAGRREWRSWPSQVRVADVRARCAVVFALAAAVPLLERVYDRYGVPEEVRAATLSDVGRHVVKTRQIFGYLGLEIATWVALHFRAGLYELGRLQYEPARLGVQGAVEWPAPERAAELGAELEWGRPVLRLHIAPGGPLDDAAVGASLGRARGFFREHFGADYPVATCTSWLLDPRLAEYLPEGSNIVRFQRRFTLVEGEGAPGEADVFRFVFRSVEVAPERAPRRTTLERALLDHLAAGGTWRVRTGWLRL
ncbi:acyltransferase domain-containing protein [Nocardiopsis trehalosi]|uniref:acyltransferase domain-containing protein n=1 Tax=Nocardiopsis trehalosi TaxID=109329 RepID=UPI000832C984|nr:acyltransferase domain-containing protein [Nocardiopsis trehalosi]